MYSRLLCGLFNHVASVSIDCAQCALGLDAFANLTDLRELAFHPFEELLIADFRIPVEVDASDHCDEFLI